MLMLVTRQDMPEYFDFLDLVKLHQEIAAAKRYEPIIVPPFDYRGDISHTRDLSDCHGKTIVRYRGKEKTCYEWAKSVGIHRSTFVNRLRDGWTFVDAISKPVAAQGGKGKA